MFIWKQYIKQNNNYDNDSNKFLLTKKLDDN